MPVKIGFGAAAAVACSVLLGCNLGASRPSNVAAGTIYEPGEPTYDGFFKSLYSVQLAMGRAPDREQSIRQDVAKIANTPSTASTDELSSALDKRLAALAKDGVSVRVSTADLDGSDPRAKCVKTGASSADTDAVTLLEKSVHDAAELLVELRHAKPELARLKDALPPLESRVDIAFRDEISRKKAEVRKNLADAGKLLPLMVAREQEVDSRIVELLRALEKASPPTVTTPPAAPSDAATPKKKDKKGGAPKGALARSPLPDKPPKATATEPPPEPRPAKPAEQPKPEKPKAPSQDFEP